MGQINLYVIFDMIESSGFLDWDSNFFGFKVAIIKVGLGNDRQIEEEIIRLLNIGSRLIYINSHRPLNLSKFRALLADIKRSYVLSAPQYKNTENHIITVTGDSTSLYDLAYQAGEYSRYKVDPNIGEAEFKRLYRTWIDNSINNGFADYVLATIDKGHPIGLITAKKRQQELSVGLFATDKEYRGQGIGSGLFQEIINIASKQNLAVEVTTQADNKTACAFYEHKGFEIASEEYVYHVWND